MNVSLRDVREADLPVLFEQQLDPEANRIAAFHPRSRDEFAAHWKTILADPSKVKKAVLLDGQVVGNMVAFERDGRREVGYWIGREHWGRGIATDALRLFLKQVPVRPLHAVVAAHNAASIRVLEKCGFTVADRSRGSAGGRGPVVEELVFRLDADESLRTSADYVVLLHGLGRTRLSMTVPQLLLQHAGFEALSIDYPSRKKPIPELADLVAEKLEARIRDRDRRVHFLTHSLGGIVLRTLLSEGRPPDLQLGHVVMLAPPNQGSRLAERFADRLLFRVATGPAGQQLRAGPGGLAGELAPPDYAVGVIAGSKAVGPWAFLVRGDSDGTVSVDETTLEGMTDFLVVPRAHTFIMNDPAVIYQAIHFFRHGKFAHSGR